MRAQLLLLLEPSEDEPAQAAIARSALTDPQLTDPQCTACVAADLATNADQQPCSQGLRIVLTRRSRLATRGLSNADAAL